MEKIKCALEAAQLAHHTYEEIELGGKVDENWPHWYAEFLKKNHNEIFKLKNINEIEELLKEVSIEYYDLPDVARDMIDWKIYYSVYLLSKINEE